MESLNLLKDSGESGASIAAIFDIKDGIFDYSWRHVLPAGLYMPVEASAHFIINNIEENTNRRYSFCPFNYTTLVSMRL